MANLPESATWEAGIYQLEETDPVQGGPNGIDNQQGKQLANRTAYLKALVDALGIDKLALAALASQAEAVAGTDNTKWMSPLRVAQAIAALATIAMASDTVAGKVELATIAETLAGTDTQRATHPAGIKAAIDAAITAIVNSSPGTLDTLNELAAALGNDPNFATSITTLIGQKQPIDGTLTALAGLTVAANKLIYATGADAFATTDLSAFMRTLLDDADATAARATLGIGGRPGHAYTANDWMPLVDGMYIQWGKVAEVTGQSDILSGSVTFPIAFPSACLGVFLGHTTINNNPDAIIYVDNTSEPPGLTSFNWRSGSVTTSSSSVGFFWLAIGK